jgi:ATP-dependent Clp protease ATP-binding subunit ClpX
MFKYKAKKLLQCSFCYKNQNDVFKIISGSDVSICDICVRLFDDLIERKSNITPYTKLPTPETVYRFLDTYVVGQNNAKKILSVAVYNHYKRINFNYQKLPVEIQKSNILLIGEPGTGKTLLAKSLSRFLDVPFVLVDATTLTQAGYVGEDVESILENLLAMSNNNLKKAEHGIIYIDEIDKISTRNKESFAMRDVSGEGVQQSLLKIIEGTQSVISPRGSKKNSEYEVNVSMDTSNILFICGGSFVGLSNLIKNRLGKQNIGFNCNTNIRKNSNVSSILTEVSIDDLILYGLIPEFVGRFSVITALDSITEKDLFIILKKPKNALIKQYKKLFAMENVSLNFTDKAIMAIIKESVKKNSGARGLRVVMENSMIEIMYKLPLIKNVVSCIITEDVILHGAEPKIKYA